LCETPRERVPERSVVLAKPEESPGIGPDDRQELLRVVSVITTKVLKDAAPQLIALDRQQAQDDLEAVESSLTAPPTRRSARSCSRRAWEIRV